jgi:hypothetical protein
MAEIRVYSRENDKRKTARNNKNKKEFMPNNIVNQ